MNTTPYQNSTRKHVKFDKFIFGTPWLLDLLCKHWFASSVWNFSRWVADVPPKRPQLRRARRNGCFRRLFRSRWNQESAGLISFNISWEKPPHTPDTPQVQTLSCKLEWTNQKHFYCFFAETNQRQSCPRVPQSSWSLSSKCAEELWVEIEYSMHCINYAKREQEKPLLFTLTLRSRFVLSRGQSPLSRAISRVWPVKT